MTLAGAALLALVVFVPAGAALAFHGGGVAHCDGCHSMHNSADNPVSGATNNLLLKGSDPSSTCLNCHNGNGGYHVNSTDGSNTNAGGDFYWLTVDYVFVVRGNTTTMEGQNRGHNVIATDYGLVADTDVDNTDSPGGDYPSASLGCNSCHDPHGKVAGGTKGGSPPISVSGSYGAADPTDGSIHGNYRLLGDTSYTPPGGSAFTHAAPIARANGSNGLAVDYGYGMSEWCSNCHGAFVGDSHKHPSGNGEHLNGYGTNYNSYVATGNFTGSASSAYDPLVSFERGITDGSLLSVTSNQGTDSNSNVMCLTCHRAHASAHENAGRWDFGTEYIAESAVDEAIAEGEVPATSAPYYDRTGKIDVAAKYGPWQRSLCNKCHVQD